ncbi:hypothetical protein HHI36_007430 [Cryptolaemus montrouzieri]|uniref:Uncharacterized protein n=1 Tax=Cryptolaemus montrouzieri TaxID=559131 RepID=A0ABD2MQ12_9CUCU
MKQLKISSEKIDNSLPIENMWQNFKEDKQMKKQNQKEYAECNMAVRRSFRKDKSNFVETIAADKNDSKELYKQMRQLGDNKRKNRDLPIRDENEHLLYITNRSN